MEASVTIPLESLDTNDVLEPKLKGDTSNGVGPGDATGTDESKVRYVAACSYKNLRCFCILGGRGLAKGRLSTVAGCYERDGQPRSVC